MHNLFNGKKELRKSLILFRKEAPNIIKLFHSKLGHIGHH